MSSKFILEFKNIQKTFRGNTILNEFNLQIRENEIFALIGKSGCGKSTVLKILLGVYKPSRGELLYNGEDLIRNRKLLKNIVGYVSQENSFYELLSVRENLEFFGKLYKVSKEDIEFRIKNLLHLVRLESAADTISSNLSGGMKRRLEFAISLIHNPHILILDEPFAGLDIELRDELWKLLETIRDSQVTVIIISHLLSSVQKHANRAGIIHKRNIKKIVELKDTNAHLEKEFLEVVKK